MKKRTLSIIAILGVLVFSATGCNSNSNKKVEEKKKVTSITIADQPGYIPIKVADKLGYFKDEFGKDGITINIKSFTSGPPMIEAFAAGDLDLALLGDQPVIQARANNNDLKAIASFTSSEKAYGLVATKESGINTLKDIKGKKIGVSVGTTMHQLFMIYLKSIGLKEDDVQMVNLQPSDCIAAIKSKTIDATVINQPSLNICIRNGAKLITDATGYKNVAVVIAGRNKFLKDNPELTARFLKVMDKATKWANANENETIDIVSEKSGTDKQDVKVIFETSDRSINLNQKTVSSIEDTSKFLKEQGIVKTEVKINDIIDSSYLKAAALK